MIEDPRCCGSGTCIIDTEGRCWCGQQWDGQKMCLPVSGSPSDATAPEPTDEPGGGKFPS
jgi:hypothetical protein